MKILQYILLSLTIFISQNLFCMVQNPSNKAILETLDKHLEDQNYKALTDLLYNQLNQSIGNLDIERWIQNKAYLTGSVHLFYFRIRELYNKANSKNLILEANDLKQALKLILISLIRIKQDTACCIDLGDKELASKAQTTYNTFKNKFWYYWKNTILEKEKENALPDYKKTLEQAANVFLQKNNPPKLPSPAWVVCCDFKKHGLPLITLWTTWGIDFSSPSEILKQAFNKDFSKTRSEALKKVIEDFVKISTWAEFFSDCTK